MQERDNKNAQRHAGAANNGQEGERRQESYKYQQRFNNQVKVIRDLKPGQVYVNPSFMASQAKEESKTIKRSMNQSMKKQGAADSFSSQLDSMVKNKIKNEQVDSQADRLD